MSGFDVWGDSSGLPYNPYGYVPSPEWQALLENTAPGILDEMAKQTVTPTQSWIDTALRTISTLTMADSQRRLLNIQLDRAAKGLPPLDASAYTPGVAVNVGLDPTIRNALLLGGGVLLVVWLSRQGR